MAANTKKFTVILDPEDDGGYSVYCPALPGCVSQGDDRNSALGNIKEAIALVLETLEDEDVTEARVLETIQSQNAPPSETLDVVADEIREVLKARQEDGLPLTIETAQVEVPYQVPV